MTGRSTYPPTMTHVRRALSQPLPGLTVQLEMAPAYRAEMLKNRVPSPTHKEAGVLILLYPYNAQVCFPLTRRTDSVASHKGQISLPGGAREAGESLQTTAIRETCEELGVCYDQLSILGKLTPLYIPPSDFLITPFVAISPTRPAFHPDPIEVAELIETPLTLLLTPATIAREIWTIRDTPVVVPFFNINGHKVWGATAMVLNELITLLRGVLS